VGDNYSAGLTGAAIASYLNWPILFVGADLSNSTEDALVRLGASTVVSSGPISEKVLSRLADLNLTVVEGDNELLIQEMRARGDEVESVVLANSRDLSLLAAKPESELKRTESDDNLLLEVEVNPTEIPSESEGEIVRLKVTLKNSGEEELEDVALTDLIMPARLVVWWSTASGELELVDPLTGTEPNVNSAFFDGSLLNWTLDSLGPSEFATLNLEVMVLHALDAGWTQPLDGGISVTYSGMEANGEDENGNGIEVVDDRPFVNITYPSQTSPGWTEISWEVARQPFHVVLNYYSPDGWIDSQTFQDCNPDTVCTTSVLFSRPGTWTFNLEAWGERRGCRSSNRELHCGGRHLCKPHKRDRLQPHQDPQALPHIGRDGRGEERDRGGRSQKPPRSGPCRGGGGSPDACRRPGNLSAVPDRGRRSRISSLHTHGRKARGGGL